MACHSFWVYRARALSALFWIWRREICWEHRFGIGKNGHLCSLHRSRSIGDERDEWGNLRFHLERF